MASQDRLTRAKRESAGRRAEQLAALLLTLKGYRLHERRFQSGRGEIDLIASRLNTVAFVEVKTRELALTAMTPMSENRIAQAAVIWMARHPALSSHNVRYDLITVVNGWPRHHKDILRPEIAAQRPDNLF